MAEYVNDDKPIIFKNETDCDFNVDVGVIFRKSGIYEISINDKTTTVTKISERKTGRWMFDGIVWKCSKCGCNPTKGMGYVQGHDELYAFCPNCGARMEGEKNEKI